MSPLAKQIISSLSEEKDNMILAEVLDFYEYLKEKRKKDRETQWQNVEEEIPTDEEVNIIKNYSGNKATDASLTTLDRLAEELGLNE